MNKWLAYLLSIFLWPSGIIIYLIKGGRENSEEDKHAANNCLWITIILGVVLAVLTLVSIIATVTII